MKKVLKRLAAIALLALIGVLAAVPALAYTAVNGTNQSMFKQYLIVDSDASIPAVTFTYSVTPGAAVAADTANKKPAVLAGVGTPTAGNAVFTSGETQYDTKQTGDDALTLASDKAYASKSVSVNFSSVSFNQPGIYRYVLTAVENASNKAVEYDTQVGSGNTATIRYIDVYVVDDSGSLTVSQYLMHTTTEVAATNVSAGDVSDKSTSIVNTVTSYDLAFGKEVTGNQGSKDKYFKFFLSIDNAQANTTYTVDITGAESSPTKTDASKYDSMSNPTTIVTGDNGARQAFFYLKDGQYITVKGLPAGTHYALTEDNEDYAQTSGIAADNNASGVAYQDPTDKITGEGLNSDIKTGYTNTRSGVIPTGVIIAVAPFAAGLVIFGGGAVYLTAKRSRDDE